MADAEREYASKLSWLLKCAIAVGQREPGAVARAKNARQQYEAAVLELRRSERAKGREGSINWISSKVGITTHSVAPNRTNTDYESQLKVYQRTVQEALDDLKRATW